MTTEQTSSLLGNSAQVNNIHYAYETEFMDEKMDSLEKEQRRMLSLVEAEKDVLDENNFFRKVILVTLGRSAFDISFDEGKVWFMGSAATLAVLYVI